MGFQGPLEKDFNSTSLLAHNCKKKLTTALLQTKVAKQVQFTQEEAETKTGGLKWLQLIKIKGLSYSKKGIWSWPT